MAICHVSSSIHRTSAQAVGYFGRRMGAPSARTLGQPWAAFWAATRPKAVRQDPRHDQFATEPAIAVRSHDHMSTDV